MDLPDTQRMDDDLPSTQMMDDDDAETGRPLLVKQ